MGKSYRCWCPRGQDCKKKNATIAVKQTKKEARWAVVNHLHSSTCHNLVWGEAEKIVDKDKSCIASEDDGEDDGGTTVNNTHLLVESDQVVVDRDELEKIKIAMEACLSVCERACVVFKDAASTIEKKLRPRTPRVV